jgi:hypothetical protein
MIFHDQYKSMWESGNINMPEEALTPDAKTKEWYLNWARYIYSLYSSGHCFFNIGGSGAMTSGGRSISDLREYGRGRQSSSKYRKILDPKYDDKKAVSHQKSLLNISWANSLVYQKFRDVAVSKIMAIDFTPSVVGIDDLAISERERKMFSDKFAAAPQTKALAQMAGVEMEDKNMASEDIDALYRLGYYKLSEETVLSSAIKTTLEINDFPAIREKLAEDSVDLGIFAVHAFHRPDGSVGVKYVDPERLIVPKSAHKTFDDAEFIATIDDIYLHELAEFGATKQDYEEIARKYSRNEAARTMGWGNGSNIDFSKGIPTNRRVSVMHLYFIAVDVERYVAGRRPEGQRVYDKVGLNSKLDRRDIASGKRIDTNIIQSVYKCSWVVGTDCVFGCEKADTIVREGEVGNKKAVLPIIVYGSDDPSITERCIPYIDNIEIAWKKRQQAIASAPPAPNIAIDTSIALPSLSIGGVDHSMTDLFNMYQANGVLYLATRNEWSAAAGASNRSPIIQLPSNVGEQIAAFREDIATNLEFIRGVTGISEFADGSANASRVLNGVAEGLQNAADNAQQPRFFAIERVCKKLAKVIGGKYQSFVMAKGDVALKHIPISGNLVSIVNVNKDVFKYKFEYVVRQLPSQRDIDMLLQMIAQRRDKGELGEDGFMMIYNYLREREVEMAMYFLPRYVAEKRMQDAAAQQQAMVTQSQAQAQAAQMIEKAKQETIMLKMQGDKELLQMKIDAEREGRGFERQKQADMTLLQGQIQKESQQNLATLKQNV